MFQLSEEWIGNMRPLLGIERERAESAAAIYVHGEPLGNVVVPEAVLEHSDGFSDVGHVEVAALIDLHRRIRAAKGAGDVADLPRFFASVRGEKTWEIGNVT